MRDPRHTAAPTIWREIKDSDLLERGLSADDVCSMVASIVKDFGIGTPYVVKDIHEMDSVVKERPDDLLMVIHNKVEPSEDDEDPFVVLVMRPWSEGHPAMRVIEVLDDYPDDVPTWWYCAYPLNEEGIEERNECWQEDPTLRPAF